MTLTITPSHSMLTPPTVYVVYPFLSPPWVLCLPVVCCTLGWRKKGEGHNGKHWAGVRERQLLSDECHAPCPGLYCTPNRERNEGGGGGRLGLVALCWATLYGRTVSYHEYKGSLGRPKGCQVSQGQAPRSSFSFKVTLDCLHLDPSLSGVNSSGIGT